MLRIEDVGQRPAEIRKEIQFRHLVMRQLQQKCPGLFTENLWTVTAQRPELEWRRGAEVCCSCKAVPWSNPIVTRWLSDVGFKFKVLGWQYSAQRTDYQHRSPTFMGMSLGPGGYYCTEAVARTLGLSDVSDAHPSGAAKVLLTDLSAPGLPLWSHIKFM